MLQKVVRDNIDKQKNDKIENATQEILRNALKEVNTEDNAATTLSRVIQGHTNRKRNKYSNKDDPEIAAKRREQVSNKKPSTLLQQPIPTYTKS